MKILLVENDFCLSELLTEVLTEDGFKVQAVSDGLSPLKLIKRYQYDLIIMSSMLPKLNGIELCRQLRIQGYHLPIMFWSSQDFPGFKQAVKQAGANDCLPKPCKISTLLQRINRLLAPQPIQLKKQIEREQFALNNLQFA